MHHQRFYDKSSAIPSIRSPGMPFFSQSDTTLSLQTPSKTNDHSIVQPCLESITMSTCNRTYQLDVSSNSDLDAKLTMVFGVLDSANGFLGILVAILVGYLQYRQMRQFNRRQPAIDELQGGGPAPAPNSNCSTNYSANSSTNSSSSASQRTPRRVYRICVSASKHILKGFPLTANSAKEILPRPLPLLSVRKMTRRRMATTSQCLSSGPLCAA